MDLILNSLRNPSLIVALLMLPMAWHVFGFYGSEPMFIRALLAVSFEILALFLFSLVVRKDGQKTTVWAALSLLISFQAYVNIYQLWNPEAKVKSVLAGGIFPALFAFSVFLISKQDEREKAAEIRRQKRADHIPDVGKTMLEAELQEAQKTLITKEEAAAAFQAGKPAKTFSDAPNYRSVTRWYKAFEESK